MSNFITVFKLLFRNMLRKDKSQNSKKRVAAFIVLAVAYAIIAALFVGFIYLLGNSFVMYELESEFITLILMCSLIFVLFFGIAAILSCLYFSRDTDFFLALPVKPSVVFAAKLALVYITELFVTALILIPCLICAGVVMHMGAAYYVLLPFAVVFTPAIPLFLGSIVSIPVMYVVSFFKNRGALGSITVLLLFGAFFVLYYVAISKMQNLNPETLDLSSLQGMFANISNTVYPLYALAKAMTLSPVLGLSIAVSELINILIFIGSVCAVGVIAMLISSAVYRRGAAAQLEGAKRTKASAVEYRSSGTVKALMKKEWRELIRTPSFALNCLLSIIVGPIIVGFMGFTSDFTAIANGMTPEEQKLAAATMRFVLLWVIMFMSVGMNMGAATAFTREGDKFYFAKLLPVDYKTQIKAKSYLYMILGIVSSLTGIIALSIVNFDIVFLICSIGFLLIYNYAFVHFAMFNDLRKPKLNWVTPNEAMKHNFNASLPMFIDAVLSVAFVFCAVLIMYGVNMNASRYSLGMALAWIILYLFAFVAAALGSAFLYKDCEKRFESIKL